MSAFTPDYVQPRRINWRLYRDIAIVAFCMLAMMLKPNDEPTRTATHNEEHTDGYLARIDQ